jgi:uncharacterized membrane protein
MGFNKCPRYYKNPETYSRVMLLEGILLLIPVLFAIMHMIYTNKEKVFFSLLTCLGLVMNFYINGQYTGHV